MSNIVKPNQMYPNMGHRFMGHTQLIGKKVDLGLSIEDRKVLLAQASSEANKIYTHPNFDLASRYVNQIPTYGNFVG